VDRSYTATFSESGAVFTYASFAMYRIAVYDGVVPAMTWLTRTYR
jgi:hypothetical protein